MRISDWSSDVCSSDLFALSIACRSLDKGKVKHSKFQLFSQVFAQAYGQFECDVGMLSRESPQQLRQSGEQNILCDTQSHRSAPIRAREEIGSASCRERGCQ